MRPGHCGEVSTVRSRERFWKLIHPALILSAVATLATGWERPWKHRKWLLMSVLASVIVVVASLTYFVPSLVERGEGLSDEEISNKANAGLSSTGLANRRNLYRKL